MVAELLRLRLRLLANLARGRSGRIMPGAVIGRVVGFLIGLVLVVAAFAAARMLAGDDPAAAARAVVAVGDAASLAALLVPVIAVRRELMPARAFLGFGVPRGVLLPMLALLTLLGPAVLVVPAVLAPLAVWPASEAGLVVGCAALLLVQTVLSLRLGAAIGAALRGHRRGARWARGVAVVLVALAGLYALAEVAVRTAQLLPGHALARTVVALARPIDTPIATDALAVSPFGALWAAPALAAAGRSTGLALGVGAASIVVLAALWALAVVLQLRPTRRLAVVRIARRVPGWFAGTPSTPAGAVTARSFIYWARDPRYRTVFGILPVIPIVSLAALWIGGVPFTISVLVPLPMMVLMLAWSTTHNDVSYDHTAIWQHVASAVPGRADRVGRMWPPLVLGGLLVLIGSPLVAWGHGDWGVLPAVLGVGIAVLLGGVGVGSGLSARFPYPAPRPGDGAFRYPQVAGNYSGGEAQAISIILVVLTAVPALAGGGLYLLFGGPWAWASLGAGLLIGGVTLVLGLVGGSDRFDRRGPELLAFAMRN